ncbi:MAG: hypothetical protein ACI8SE_000880, partial [Bacteroidia bacterium]
MRALFKKLDHQMLEKYPNLWVLGVHIYIPILAILYIIIALIGLIYPLKPLPDFYHYEDFFNNISVTMSLPTILLFVVFVIRQVKFNSRRVHLSLPFRHSFLVFVYFMVLTLGITALPFIGNLAGYVKTNAVLDKAQFELDESAMEEGFAHFYLQKNYIDDPEDCAEAEARGYYIDEYGDHRHNTRYELNKTRDSLILYRDFVDYSYDQGLDTISLDQAYNEIEAFIAVAGKYEGGVTLSNPVSIVQANLSSDRFYTKFENNFAPAFNHLKNYGRFDNNINFHNRLINKRSFFYPLEWEFWRFYFLLTLALSVLLIILCSVNIAEFGWGMLVVALHPTVFGIVGALVAFMFQDVSGEKAAVIGIVLLLLFTLNAYIIAFFKGFKPSLRRAFAIACHIYTPIA